MNTYYVGTLEKIESWHDNMPVITQLVFYDLPEVGKVFLFNARGHTTTVQSVKKGDGVFFFRTQNSVYKLEFTIVEKENEKVH
jgi:hypothetical protein